MSKGSFKSGARHWLAVSLSCTRHAFGVLTAMYRWMLHHKVAVRDEHGNIVKWHGSSIDIEDRKRAEVALQQSQFYLEPIS